MVVVVNKMIDLDYIIETQRPSLITHLNESERDIDLFVLVAKANYRTHVKNDYYRTDLHLYSESEITRRIKWQQLTCPIIFGLYSPVLFGDNSLKTLVDEIPIRSLLKMLKFSVIGEFGSKACLSLKESKYFIKDMGLLLSIIHSHHLNDDVIMGWRTSLLSHETLRHYYYQTHEQQRPFNEEDQMRLLDYLYHL